MALLCWACTAQVGDSSRGGKHTTANVLCHLFKGLGQYTAT